MAAKGSTPPETTTARLFVTGWTQQVTPEEVRKRLEGFPGIHGIVEVTLNSKRFAHVSIALKQNVTVQDVLDKLGNTYKNAKWKGGVLKFELGRPDYLARLEARRRAGQDEQQCQISEVTTHQPKPLRYEDLGHLRIRGTGRKNKGKSQLIVFNDDDDENGKNNLSFQASTKEAYAALASTPASQRAADKAACCIDETCSVPKPEVAPAAEAPSKAIPVHQPEAPKEKDQSNHEEEPNKRQKLMAPEARSTTVESVSTVAPVDADVGSSDDPSTLALANFVLKQLNENQLPKTKPRKNKPTSLIAEWSGQQAMSATTSQ